MPSAPELPTLEFPDQRAWESWLQTNHASSEGVWLRIAKKAASTSTVSYQEAVEGALCYGWIDGQGRPYDEHFYLQRFTPRRPRSKWSQINKDKAMKLAADGRMQTAGHAQVAAAKQDGRWDAAYQPQSRATVPDDFQAELDRNPVAKAFFATLDGANRYAFIYRINDAKRPETRARRIASYIEMLDEHRTLH
jgi:uncharacterized protein YdeI (YjbR/CyaY-like superfamily)